MPRSTFLTALHRRHGARLVDFHGWNLPLQYDGILAEHRQCRETAVVFDTCHMGRLCLSGPRAGRDLSALLTQDAARQPVGACRYGLLLNEQGGILDDTIAMRLEEDEYLLVVNAGTAESDRDWVAAHCSSDTLLTDLTAAWGKIDVQGPASYRVLDGLLDFDLAALKYFQVRRCAWRGREAIVSRTGYTGELGYEIFMPGTVLTEFFSVLLDSEAVRPAGLGARDLLRLEMAYPLYGRDIDSACNPLEADLDRFVTWDHEFIGAAALQGVRNAGPRRKLVAFACDSRRRPEPGSDISCGADRVGQVTSGAFSPSLGVSIGLGFVQAGHARAGTALSVRTAREPLPAKVLAKPPYTGGTCRQKILKEEA